MAQQAAPTAPLQMPIPQAPAAAARTLWGFPLYVWLLVASSVAVVALFMPWYSSQMSYGVSWKTTGYEYSNGTRSTWDIPVVSNSTYGGGNGASAFTLLLALTGGTLGYIYRNRTWPRWARYTLVAVTGLILFVGVVNVLSDAHFGPLLFGAAGALAVPATLRVLQGR